MMEVYSWATPNGHKVHIMLEECGLAYRAHAVDIGAGDQFKPEFLALDVRPLRRPPFQTPGRGAQAAVDDEAFVLHPAESVLLGLGPGCDAFPAFGRRRRATGEQALEAFEHGLESVTMAAHDSLRRAGREEHP